MSQNHAANLNQTSLARMSGFVRGSVGIGVLVLLGWAALIAPGCAGHGKYTTAHKSGAKAKMEGMKAATEYQMAHQAFLAGDLPKAQRHIDYSIALNEKVARSHVLRGRIFLEMSNLEAAGLSLAKAAEVDETNADAQYFQGILAERIAKTDEALAFYQKAADLDRQNPQYAVAAGEMMIEQGRLDEAEGYLNSRSETFRHNAGVRQTLGHIAMMRGDANAAVELFDQARLLAPTNLAIVEDLIRAQMATARFGDAEVNISRLLATDAYKGRRELQHLRAKCLVQVQRPVDARQVLIGLTSDQTGAGDVQAWIGLGEVALLLKDLPRVRLCATRVIALSPNRPDGYVLKALHQQRTGDLPGARESILRAIELSRAADSLVLLGMIEEDLGNAQDAHAAYAEAVRVDPRHPNAGRLLSQIEATALAGSPE
jgi:tetratricopeptide (TPR) repeat protein